MNHLIGRELQHYNEVKLLKPDDWWILQMMMNYNYTLNQHIRLLRV